MVMVLVLKEIYHIFESYKYISNSYPLKKIYLVASLSILFFQYALSGHAQKMIYGRRLYDPYFSINAYCTRETNNHSILIGGDDQGKAIVLSLDQSGLLQWSKTIGQMPGSFSSMTSTFDSCFVLAGGISKPSGSGNNCFVVKLTAAGDTIWTRQLNMGGSDHINSIKETQDHGFILSGDTSDSLVIVARLNSMGFLIWGKSYGCGSKDNIAYCAEQTADSGYIVSGFIQNYAPGDAGIFLMKLTSGGEISWEKNELLR